MKYLFAVLFFLIANLISGCSDEPGKVGLSHDEQRAHAEQAHGELSSEVKK